MKKPTGRKSGEIIIKSLLVIKFKIASKVASIIFIFWKNLFKTIKMYLDFIFRERKKKYQQYS